MHLSRCPVQGGAGLFLPSPGSEEGSAGGGQAAHPPQLCCWGIVSHTAAATELLLPPNHCPSTLHKNPHQVWQPSSYSRTCLSLRRKRCCIMREIMSNQYLTSQQNIFAMDSFLSVNLWCAPVFQNSKLYLQTTVKSHFFAI